jgi:SAM-dependent methyltransferase
MSSAQPHSSAYLNDLRNQWWNEDYLDLVAQRLEIGKVQSLLDVGCGLGHWAQNWYPRLAPGASLWGVDLEPQWVKGASESFAQQFPGSEVRAQFKVGSATSLPFPDNELDAVTCQTVLMHLPEPERAIAEMVRVLRPGGLVFCAEPNNFYNYLSWNDASATRPVDEIACMAEFWTRQIRGKKAQGRGDDAIGDRLPSLLTAAGLVDVGAWQTDRALSFTPPYGDFQKSYMKWMKEIRAAGTGPWDEKKMRARVLASGGEDAFFDKAFAVLHAWADDDAARFEAGAYSSNVGPSFFLVSGKKPAS